MFDDICNIGDMYDVGDTGDIDDICDIGDMCDVDICDIGDMCGIDISDINDICDDTSRCTVPSFDSSGFVKSNQCIPWSGSQHVRSHWI